MSGILNFVNTKRKIFIITNNLDTFIAIIAFPYAMYSAYKLNIESGIFYAVVSMISMFILMISSCYIFNKTYMHFENNYELIKRMNQLTNKYFYNLKHIVLIHLSIACPTYLLNDGFDSPLTIIIEIAGKILYISFFPVLPMPVIFLLVLITLILVEHIMYSSSKYPQF